MRLIRFSKGEEAGYGQLEGESIREVAAPEGDWSEDAFRKTGRAFNLNEVKLLAPCRPGKVVCVGLNYRKHAAEVGASLPEKPIIFLKPSTSVSGTGDPIMIPSQSCRVDYEAELAVVLGRRTHRVCADRALDYVFGYTCANDVTARDLQPQNGQWTYAKSFDTFCPLGPAINTGIANPEALPVKGVLNGKAVQDGNTADHLFSVAELIEYISHCMTLLPGDVIMTGTPAGIGPLNPGDTFSVVIGGIGSLTNPVNKENDRTVHG